MIINKDSLTLYETYQISIPESTLIKLEDGARNKKEMLLTIQASHYGFRNRNWTIYRHDTVKHDIMSFVAPSPKPIIQKHNPKESDVFGRVIAADYKLTKFYNDFAKGHKLEKLTTDEYISLMRDTILPYQRSNPYFDGLAYLELVGRLDSKIGIKKVIDKEFLTVSIGASPNRLICSECGQDQVLKMCNHYGNKANDTFMLAESLNYKELSFVDKPADPFGRITTIHDNVEKDYKFEIEQKLLSATMDAIPMKEFFQLTDKTIVCVDNICTIINQEEPSMKKKGTTNTVAISYQDEFGQEKTKSLLDSFGEGTTISELDSETLTDRQFAIVQSADDGVKRRFPLNDEVNVKLAMSLLKDAEDLSPAEYDRAFTSITKAAKKFGIECDILIKDEAAQDTQDQDNTDVDTSNVDTQDSDNTDQDSANDTQEDKVKEVCDAFAELLKEFCKENEEYFNEDGSLKDAETAPKEPQKPSPISVLFSIISSFANEIRYAGTYLQQSIDSYLKELGKESIDKATKDSLTDENQALKDSVAELEEEVALLDDQTRTLNKQLRTHFVEEIISHKKALGLIDQEDEAEIAKYSKLGYEALQVCMNDFREMRIKIKDSTVNNSTSIKTIKDPTQIADSITDQVTDETTDPSPDQKKSITKEDAINIINNLKTRYGFF